MGLTCTRCGSTHSEAPFLCSGGHHHDWVDAGAAEEAALSRVVVEAVMFSYRNGSLSVDDAAGWNPRNVEAACAALAKFRSQK